jgi:hypothetical protein
MSSPSRNTLGRPRPFAGERVAIAGKLSSMSRGEAGRLITEQGGELVALENPDLTLIVRGDEAEESESLPARVERIVVIDETQFLRRLGLLEEEKGVSRLYTPGLLAKMVDVEPRVIRRWHRRGYLVAVSEVRKLPYFDFSELRIARRLADLVHSGGTHTSLDRQVASLTTALPDVARPLADLALEVKDGRFYLRRDGELAEPGGQRLIDFEASATEADDERPAIAAVCERGLPSLDALRQEALDQQDAGETRQALMTLRAVLLSGSAEAEDHFLAADLLYQMGDASAARERYFMAIEMDDEYVEARANLGCVLMELGDVELAIASFRGALERHEDFADAHYYLAQALDSCGERDEAERHWESFLRLAPESPWAEEAVERLRERGSR